MYVITENSNIILAVSQIAERLDTGNILVDNCEISIKGTVIYEVDTIPEGVDPFNYCYSPEKGFYPYVEPPPKPEEKSDIEILIEEAEGLKKENAMLQMSVMELSTYSALQDERLQGQEQAILELSMLVAGGGA